jgi:hypothetical protein
VILFVVFAVCHHVRVLDHIILAAPTLPLLNSRTLEVEGHPNMNQGPEDQVVWGMEAPEFRHWLASSLLTSTAVVLQGLKCLLPPILPLAQSQLV